MGCRTFALTAPFPITVPRILCFPIDARMRLAGGIATTPVRSSAEKGPLPLERAFNNRVTAPLSTPGATVTADQPTGVGTSVNREVRWGDATAGEAATGCVETATAPHWVEAFLTPHEPLTALQPTEKPPGVTVG